MAIELEYGKYFVTCDACGDTLIEEDTHLNARHAAREAGWKASKTNSGWINVCPTCSAEYPELVGGKL